MCRPPDPLSSDDMNVHVLTSNNLMVVSLFPFILSPALARLGRSAFPGFLAFKRWRGVAGASCPLTAGRCCWSASWWRPAAPGTSRRSDAGWSSGSPAPEGPRCQTAPAAADGDKDGQGFFGLSRYILIQLRWGWKKKPLGCSDPETTPWPNVSTIPKKLGHARNAQLVLGSQADWKRNIHVVKQFSN